MKTVAFIPARAGSKGIPGKNMKLFAGKPLIQWSIEQAKTAGIFNQIIVSSDDGDILNLAADMECNPEPRVFELSQDQTPLDDVLYDYFYRHQHDKIDYICLLQPTSPLRSVEDIKGSFKFIKQKKYTSVVGVTWNPIMGWVEEATKKGPGCLYLIHKRPNRQTRGDFFLENGAIYWMKLDTILRSGNRIGTPLQTKLYHMPPERSLEVDTYFNWYMAEKAMIYPVALSENA